MNIKEQFEVRRVPLGKITTDIQSFYEETFNTKDAALKAIEEWYKENLCTSGTFSVRDWQFIIIPVTIVSL